MTNNTFTRSALTIEQTAQLFNWDYLHLGGGNAKRIDFELAKNVRIVDNDEGLLGGVALWRNEQHD